MSKPYDDEIIADSEEEDGYFPISTGHARPDFVHDTIDHFETMEQSSIATFNTGPTERSNISLFTDQSVIIPQSDISSVPASNSAQSIIESSSSKADTLPTITIRKERPKPRPIKRKTSDDASPQISSTSSSSGNLPDKEATGRKERPRPRQIKRKSPETSSSSRSVDPPISTREVMNEGLGFESFDMDIAERAKVRRRNAKSNAYSEPTPSLAIVSPPRKPKRKAISDDTIPHSPDVIELTSEDDELALKGPPPKPKKKAKADSATRRAQAKPKPVSNPIIPAAQAIAEPSSQPSIPLPSSSLSFPNPIPSQLPPSDPPGSPLTEPEFPPIAALSEPDSVDMDINLGGSLFTPMAATRKRKRNVVYDDSDSENMETFDKPPPPTFFASSSPPPADVDPPPNDAPLLDDVPSSRGDSNPASVKGPTKKSKASVKRKKKDTSSDPSFLPEGSKKKPKAKSKNKEVVDKSSDGANNEGKLSTNTRKGRGKMKAAEPAKSREFIEEEDDEISIDALNSTSLDDIPPDQDVSIPISSPSKELEANTQNLNKVDPSAAKTVNQKAKRAKGKQSTKSKDATYENSPSRQANISNDGDDDFHVEERPPSSKSGSFKENRLPESTTMPSIETPGKVAESNRPVKSSLTSRYSIAPRTKSTPMSELIRRVNSLPGSPFAPSPASRAGIAYSPYLKSSKSMLSRIAPLHPNRRTPPPPPPPPPPRKKTKKEIEREEKWEEELIESIGGLDAWVAMSDADRKELRRGKWEMEMNGWDD